MMSVPTIGNQKKVKSNYKKIIKFRTEINEISKKKSIEKIRETKRWNNKLIYRGVQKWKSI